MQKNIILILRENPIFYSSSFEQRLYHYKEYFLDNINKIILKYFYYLLEISNKEQINKFLEKQ